MAVTTPGQPQAWRPDQTAFVADEVVPDALILQTSTVVGSIEGDEPSVRVPFVADDGTAGFVAEGAPIDDANQQFDEVVVTTGKIATIGQYSYEALQQPNAASMIVQSLNRSIVGKANTAFLGNTTDPTGLLNAGITDAGALGDDLDTLVDAVAGIEAAGGTVTGLIASPDAWATVAKLKTATDSNANLLGAGTEATERRVLGVPALVTAAMPASSLLLVDKTAVIAAQSPVRLARSEDAYFTNDVIAVRVTWRLGWSVMHTDRLAKLSTEAPTG